MLGSRSPCAPPLRRGVAQHRLGLLVGFACWVVLYACLSLEGRSHAAPLAAWFPAALYAGAGRSFFRGVGR